MAAATGTTMPSCNTCKKSPPEVPNLKRCAKCWNTSYCSRDCQKADWKTHKKTCRTQASGSAASAQPVKMSPPKGVDAPVAKPFTRLEAGTWLHDRSEKDVYRLLIDAYRLRMEDTYKFDGEADEDSIYGGAANGLRGFRSFLDKVARKSNLLPPWWNDEKRKACEEMGMDRRAANFHDLSCAVEKSDITEHYGDPQFPMQLRMFAEAVYGRGPGGMSGASMRGMMMAMEGGDDSRVMSMFDVS